MKRDRDHFAHFSIFIPNQTYGDLLEMQNQLSKMASKKISFPKVFEFAIEALKRELAIDPVRTARPVIDEKAKVLKVWNKNGRSFYQAYDIIDSKPRRKLKKVVGSGVFGYHVDDGRYKV